MNSYNAPDSVNQVNWDLINERQESIDFIRQIIRLKHKGGLSLILHTKKFIVMSSSIQLLKIVGGLFYEIHGGSENLLVVFNAKGTSSTLKMQEI